MATTPLILPSSEDPGRPLRRLDIQPGSGMDEAWLQALIYQRPEILPAAHFDDSYAPLIPLGREVPTPRGPIDNLYVSPEGLLTVVETKLWKNPEKHRTVVAQVLDYAKELAAWSYDDLVAAVQSASRGHQASNDTSLEDRVRPELARQSIDFIDFQEGLVKSLAAGNMLLLIVGDRVSANVALLTDAVQGAPGFDFTIGLVELQLYSTVEGAAWPLLVVPDVVGRTVEKTRGVVRVIYENAKPVVSVNFEESSSDSQPLDWPLFLASVPVELRPLYQQAREAWMKLGRVRIAKKRIFFEVEMAGAWHKIVRTDEGWIAVLPRKYFDKIEGAESAIYDAYVKRISASDVATRTLHTGKSWIRLRDLGATDLETILGAAVDLATALQKDA